MDAGKSDWSGTESESRERWRAESEEKMLLTFRLNIFGGRFVCVCRSRRMTRRDRRVLEPINRKGECGSFTLCRGGLFLPNNGNAGDGMLSADKETSCRWPGMGCVMGRGGTRNTSLMHAVFEVVGLLGRGSGLRVQEVK